MASRSGESTRGTEQGARDRGSRSSKVRLDRWLWAARFFKSRSLATDAVGGGHVHIAGGRAKPSRPVSVGDRLTITRGSVEWTVVVRGVSGALASLGCDVARARRQHAAFRQGRDGFSAL